MMRVCSLDPADLDPETGRRERASGITARTLNIGDGWMLILSELAWINE
jgi:hypothetical protein